MGDQKTPLIRRIKANTIAAPDIEVVESWYTEWLEYSTCETGIITSSLAKSWATEEMKGRPYIVLQPKNREDVYLRVVEIDKVAKYKPMTTLGWNAFELICDDVYEVHKKLINSPFEIIGEPASLGGELDFIHAMQVEGPAQDILYITCDTKRASDTLLPACDSFVGRPFIVILAGNGVDKIQNYYSEKFCMHRDEDMQTPIGVIAKAQGLPEQHTFDMGFMSLSETGNFIEYDGYGAQYGARNQNVNQLPPGCSTVSFEVDNIDSIDLQFLGESVTENSIIYSGKRARTARGPAGELIELIET